MLSKKLLPAITAATFLFAAMNLLFINTYTLRRQIDSVESQVHPLIMICPLMLEMEFLIVPTFRY